MKPLTQILENINIQIDLYHNLKLNLVKDQSEILRALTTELYYLEEHRIHYYNKWQSVYFNSVAKSGAAKEREADHDVLELYQIRRIMTGAYKVVDSIRSTISIYKKES